jgi:hypothetical protein
MQRGDGAEEGSARAARVACPGRAWAAARFSRAMRRTSRREGRTRTISAIWRWIRYPCGALQALSPMVSAATSSSASVGARRWTSASNCERDHGRHHLASRHPDLRQRRISRFGGNDQPDSNGGGAWGFPTPIIKDWTARTAPEVPPAPPSSSPAAQTPPSHLHDYQPDRCRRGRAGLAASSVLPRRPLGSSEWVRGCTSPTRPFPPGRPGQGRFVQSLRPCMSGPGRRH